MMDNPNTNVNLRRHQSGPTYSSGGRTRRYGVTRSSAAGWLLQRKTNPYVGTFRHAPPASIHHQRQRRAVLPNGRSYNRLKQSPYVGWLRLTPTNSIAMRTNFHAMTFLEQEIMFLLRSITICKNKDGIMKLTDLLCGNLKGGCEDDFYRHSASRGRQLAGTDTLSFTPIRSLARIILWAILPENANSDRTDWGSQPSKQFDSESLSTREENDEDSDDEDEDDDEETVVSFVENHSSERSRDSARFHPLGFSVSSQAEAYYTHFLSKELAYTDLDDDEDDDNRLDYDITQMDIVRMNRNASRHLDVESIVKLPTITYHARPPLPSKKAQCQLKIVKEEDEEENMHTNEGSWMLVQRGLEVTSSEEVYSDSVPRSSERGNVNDEDQDTEHDFCVICLEHFVEGDRLRVLPCNHSFHVGCIDQWLSGSHSFDDCVTSGCPTCKKRPDSSLPKSCTPSSAAVETTSNQEWMTDPHGSVPSWAFANLGDALARNSRHF